MRCTGQIFPGALGQHIAVSVGAGGHVGQKSVQGVWVPPVNSGTCFGANGKKQVERKGKKKNRGKKAQILRAQKGFVVSGKNEEALSNTVLFSS